MLNFDFLENDVGVISWKYDFSWNMFLMLDSVNWSNIIAWLPLLLRILVNLCVVIVCFPGCDVINFEINLIPLIKLFWYIAEKLR